MPSFAFYNSTHFYKYTAFPYRVTEIQNHVMKSMHENFVGEGSFSNNMMTIHSKQNYRSTYEQMGRTQYCLLFQFAVLVMFHFIFSEE